MTNPSVEALYDVVDATWPAAGFEAVGPWVIRTGKGGGSRVSAATGDGGETDIAVAEAKMRELEQLPLFMIRDGQSALDALLEQRGYRVKDPVTLYSAPVSQLATLRPPPVTTFEVWPPLAVECELWQAGGIGPSRLAVMERADCPKTTILGRLDDQPAGVLYAGVHKDIAMIHALEITPHFRRRGLAKHMIRAASFWAQDNGAKHVSLVVTDANTNANALYQSLGMEAVGHYHYRQLEE